MPLPSQSFRRTPLAREIAVILLVKLALLLAIKAIWFSTPSLPENESEQVSAHLLGDPQRQPQPLREEKPR